MDGLTGLVPQGNQEVEADKEKAARGTHLFLAENPA